MNHAWGVFDLVLSDHSSLSPVINKNVSVGAPGPTLPKWKWCVAKYEVLLMVSKKLKRFQNKSGHTQYVTWVQDNEACYKLHEINVTLFKRDFDIKNSIRVTCNKISIILLGDIIGLRSTIDAIHVVLECILTLCMVVLYYGFMRLLWGQTASQWVIGSTFLDDFRNKPKSSPQLDNPLELTTCEDNHNAHITLLQQSICWFVINKWHMSMTNSTFQSNWNILQNIYN